MVSYVPIYKNRDLYVPAFDIKIDGKPLPNYAGKDVIDVRYSDSLDQIDSFEITVNNWDALRQDFKYTGGTKSDPDTGELIKRSELFDPGQAIELWMGYFKPPQGDSTSLRLMLIGKITKLAPSFPASGQPTLKISGQNILRDFMTKQETHVYENKTISDIAKSVGDRGNLKVGNLKIQVKPDATAKGQEQPIAYLLQDNQYDILFLMQLAHRNDYDLLFKPEDKERKTQPFLYFGPSDRASRISYTLEWNKSLIQFQPTLTTTKQVYEVSVRGWDALKKKPINVTVNRDNLQTRSLRDKKKQKKIEEGFKERKEIIVDRPFRNEQEAKNYAKARLQALAKEMVVGRGSTVGTPDLRAGSQIEITGLGTTFSGRYFIKSTTHTIGSGGYITEFEARLEEDN